MLEELAIQNLGVIRQANFPLSAGLNALTGETGAGKTMILNALNLLRGGKGDPALISNGAAELLVEGRWLVGEQEPAQLILSDSGGSTDDDGSVIAVRSVAKTKSRAHLGGRSVPAATLAEFTSELVTVHGQADQMRLRTAAKQRDALDAFAPGPHQQLLQQYREAWEQRQQVRKKLDQLTADRQARQQLAALLTEQLAEIEAIDPQVGEHAALTTQISRLSNVNALQLAVGVAYLALTGTALSFSDGSEAGYEDQMGSAIAAIEQARRELANAERDDATLAPLAERLTEVGYLINDLCAELASYADGLDADPTGLEQLQTRLGVLNSLARKHGLSADEIAEWAQQDSLQLLDLTSDDDTIATLTAQASELDQTLTTQSAELTAGRQQAAAELSEAVTGELAGLGMANSQVTIAVEPTDPGPTGSDAVTFYLIPHPGVAPRPIAKGASGGELSRLMLAIELTLAHRNAAAGTLPTFVFDEIDAGVGGRAAVEIGRRLAELAKVTQVIVVTHLAQVAAFADQQLVVAKADGETTVAKVEAKEREKEIARMLSGSDQSKTALKHAQELLAAPAGLIS